MKLKITRGSKRVEDWIDKVYSRYQASVFDPDTRIMRFPQGMVSFKLDTYLKDPDTVYFESLQAEPKGLGLGTKALQKIQQLATKEGFSIVLYPRHQGVTTPRLVAFYARLGFKPDDRTPGHMVWSPEISVHTEQQPIRIVLRGFRREH
jgi:GNAT superfamily N-acetyltransferase